MKVAKTKLWRWAAGLLAIVMLFAAVPETAFAWGYIGESCSSEYGERYLHLADVSFHLHVSLQRTYRITVMS